MNRTLYLAYVSCIDIGPAGGMINMLYVAYASSQLEAKSAIKEACGDLCSIEFREHELSVNETVERLGLQDGRARSLA